MSSVRVRLDPQLHWLLPARVRSAGERVLAAGPTQTDGHLVQAAGVPLTEVGDVTIDGASVPTSTRPAPGAVLHVVPVARPQHVPAGGFLLDVGLGGLARRARLLGLDAAWRNDADDPELVDQAAAEDRVLLTQDRRLLMRRAGPAAGARREPASGGRRGPSTVHRRPGAADPVHRVQRPADPSGEGSGGPPGRARCGRVYWRGAHAARIDALLAEVSRTASGRPATTPRR